MNKWAIGLSALTLLLAGCAIEPGGPEPAPSDGKASGYQGLTTFHGGTTTDQGTVPSAAESNGTVSTTHPFAPRIADPCDDPEPNPWHKPNCPGSTTGGAHQQLL